MMASFVRYSYKNGGEEERGFARFLVKNLAKGVLIANSILMMAYFSRFRTYRNSNLLSMHVPATLFGATCTVAGSKDLFFAFLFDRAELSHRHALKDTQILQTPSEQAFFKGRLSQGEKLVFNEVLS